MCVHIWNVSPLYGESLTARTLTTILEPAAALAVDAGLVPK